MTERITKPELSDLLSKINHYQRNADYQLGGNAPSIVDKFMGRNEYKDMALAHKVQSPLITFFTALVLLNEKPEILEQQHLDVMRDAFHNTRANAFHELHMQDEKQVFQRLSQAGLITSIPNYAPSSDFIEIDHKEEPAHYQLHNHFLKLSLTPLENVKQMINELKEERAARWQDLVNGSSILHSSRKNNDDDDEDSSPSIGLGTVKQEVSKPKHREEPPELEYERAALQLQRVHIMMQQWQDRTFREEQVAKERALVEQMLEGKKLEQQRLELQLEKERELTLGRSRHIEMDFER